MTAVSVVVLTWNDGDLCGAAIDSALASTGVPDLEVVVVDNGSEPPAMVPDDPRVRLVRSERNLGVAPGRNLGVRESRGRLCCFLDSDARLEPSALCALVAALDAHDRIALAAPVFVGQAPEASGGLAPSLVTKLMRGLNRTDRYERTRPAGAEVWDVDFAIGACQLFRRAAFDAVGGLDERYFYGPEDVDLCLRLREAGHRIVQVAGASVHHPPRRRFRGLLTRAGLAHLRAVLRHHWRHRWFHRRVGAP